MISLMVKENDMRPEQQWQFDELFSDYEAEIKARENAEKEVIEQCRLNAMGSEREAKLMAELAALQAQLAATTGRLFAYKQDWQIELARAEQAEARTAAAYDLLRDARLSLDPFEYPELCQRIEAQFESNSGYDNIHQIIAEEAYSMADAMLKERVK